MAALAADGAENEADGNGDGEEMKPQEEDDDRGFMSPPSIFQRTIEKQG